MRGYPLGRERRALNDLEERTLTPVSDDCVAIYPGSVFDSISRLEHIYVVPPSGTISCRERAFRIEGLSAAWFGDLVRRHICGKAKLRDAWSSVPTITDALAFRKKTVLR